MGLFDDIGRRLGGIGNRLATSPATSWLFGGSGTPGALGTGQYVPKQHPIDPNAATIPGYGDDISKLWTAAASSGDRRAPTSQAAQLGPAAQYGGAQINMRPQQQFRGGQLDLAAQLAASARGEGPSLAQGMLQKAGDQNLQQAMALQASQSGAGAASAMRNIANQRGQIGAQLGQDAGLLRLQEQQQAQQLLAGVLGQGRGQDIGLATTQAGLLQQAGLANQGALNQFALQQGSFNQQTGLANQQAALQQQGLNDRLVQFYVQSGLDLAQAQQRAAMDLERLKMQQHLGLEGLAYSGYRDRANDNREIIGKLAEAGAKGAGA